MTSAGVEPGLAGRVLAIAETPRLLVVVDFDGTLSPIVADPADARPLPEAVDALDRLAALPGTAVAVVSGRSLHDLAARAGTVPAVRLVGSHGAEHEPGTIAGLDDDALARRDALRAEVRALVGDVAGVRLEDKTTGVAVHVRQASRADAARVLDAVRAGPAAVPGIGAMAGHEVLELSVVETGKGRALERLRADHAPTAAFVAGDDVTDESMLELLDGDDLGLKVGSGGTSAAHRVSDPAALAAVLALLAGEREDWLTRSGFPQRPS